MLKPVHLRPLLFVSFAVVVVIPLAFHALWVGKPALDREVEAAKEKHLVLARGTAAVLARNLAEVDEVFRHALDAMELGEDLTPHVDLAGRMHLKHVCIVGPDWRIEAALNPSEIDLPERLPEALRTLLAATGARQGTAYSEVTLGLDGQPTIYLTAPLTKGRLGIGALNTTYLTAIQRSVQFGNRGHAAIVDQTGKVLAHPLKEWRMEMRDLSALEPIRRMVAGESGVVRFYSPAVQKEMIAGFASVPGVGWGAMVPQPFSELEESAHQLYRRTFQLMLLGALAAAAVGWWLAVRLARPVLDVSRAARAVADGDRGRVVPRRGLVPEEIHGLVESFNHMVQEVSAAERALREKTELLQVTMDHMAEGIAVVDRDRNVVLCSRRFTEMLDLPPQMGGGTVPCEALLRYLARRGEFGWSDDAETAVQKRLAMVPCPSSVVQEHRRPDGRTFELRCNPLPDGGQVSSLIDISDRRRAESELRLAAKALESTADAVMIADRDGKVVSVNKAFTSITGYSREEIIGRDAVVLRSGRHDDGFYGEIRASLDETGHWQGEIWDRRKNGEVFPDWLTISAVRDPDGRTTHYVSVFTDISHWKQVEAHLDHLAHHDPLTNLPNRTQFKERFHEVLLRAERYGRCAVLLYIDLDNFKTINDSLGHHIGDMLLQTVAERLVDSVRETDLLARLGGDEFTLLLDELPHARDAGPIAAKVLDSLCRPYELAGHTLYLSASVGISCFPEDGTDVQSLLRNADVAMYRAKQDGRNAYRFFSAEMNTQAVETLTLSSGLRSAIDHDELLLHFQPRVDLASGRVLGLEALARWPHPELGMVMPMRFIPVAEETGLIERLSEWVIRAACRHATAWATGGADGDWRVAVNLSARHFRRSDLPRFISGVLAEAGLPPRRLEVELTESMVMQTPDRAAGMLKELKAMGVRITIDDFGTGYSSLAYLKRFPIDCLKIDRSFVRGIPDDPDDVAIVRAVIAMARSLGMRVVAEGVETQRQRAFLEDEGCDEGQGHLFGAPAPADRFAPLPQVVAAGS